MAQVEREKAPKLRVWVSIPDAYYPNALSKKKNICFNSNKL